jgi:hypothetical protein
MRTRAGKEMTDVRRRTVQVSNGVFFGGGVRKQSKKRRGNKGSRTS